MKVLGLLLSFIPLLTWAYESEEQPPKVTLPTWTLESVGSEQHFTQSADGLSFTIMCSDQHAANAELNIRGNRYTNLVFNINGKPYYNPFNFNDPLVVEQFKWFMKALRNATAVEIVYGIGKSYTLYMSNAKAVLPDPDASNFICKTDTALTFPDDESNASPPQEDAKEGGASGLLSFNVSVGKFDKDYRPVSVQSIELVSLNNHVNVISVTGNRGQCRLAKYSEIEGVPSPRLPLAMQYGQKAQFPIVRGSGHCDKVYEVSINTNLGSVTYDIEYE